MHPDLAIKLRLTGAVLRCGGRKDLCARFRAVNPDTHFDLERSHKWLQGRALPRSAQVYDDWAKVIGTTRPGSWIAGCSVEAFLQELCRLFDADAAELRQRAAVRGTEPAAEPAPKPHYLCGHYACFSWAWSPYYRGQLIRGSMAIASAMRDGRLDATYTEELLGQPVHFQGAVLISGRTLHFDLRERQGMSPLFISLIVPGPPATVLCGIMSGATVVGPDPQPSVTRIAAVRVAADAAFSNHYLPPQDNALAEDLQALGVAGCEDAAEVARLLREFLEAGGLGQVNGADHTRLAMVLDRAYLAAN